MVALLVFLEFKKFLFSGAAPAATFGKGDGPIHFRNFYCSGSENNLLDCTYSIYSLCHYSYHAGIKCEGNYENFKTIYSWSI